jgi:putative RNA 2'-phosphotransferase
MPEIMKQFPFVTPEHIDEVVAKDAQQRLMVKKGKIRVKAGHLYPVVIPTAPISPPAFLYHGTCEEAADKILSDGIRKMGKATVHVTNTIVRAKHIGSRKTPHPVILVIDASRACAEGVRFWRSGQKSPDGEIFLSDEIPAKFVRRASEDEIATATKSKKPK